MDPLVLGGFNPVQAFPYCEEDWGSISFFLVASADDVALCLSQGADPNARDEDGFTPLDRAAAYSKTLAVVQALLDAGADLNARTED
ncbi:MAG: hypothetical protein TH68_02150, partial [Candidatus Synechococcus spongiarum 142]